jgi:hypothetical protein
VGTDEEKARSSETRVKGRTSYRHHSVGFWFGLKSDPISDRQPVTPLTMESKKRCLRFFTGSGKMLVVRLKVSANPPHTGRRPKHCPYCDAERRTRSKWAISESTAATTTSFKA